jgi:hypothetical protein
MSESEERSYPLKSLHDFLNELDYEWDKFRRAAMIGIITSGVLLIFLILRILSFLALIRKPGIGLFNILNDVIFLFLIAAFVVYEIFLLLSQYKFFKKWERRVGLLLHLEEKIMQDNYEKMCNKLNM